eukprot:TRINITY_DN6977_c0_g1_i1.p1 TRINITY_DN6977_c0_g1~~TRINITY_DN6977_c0_g1_i1.p1  ORF type:complete len:151 (-),score=28.10 TRINITY_DN6977_c0_g1_i1:34-486(-)
MSSGKQFPYPEEASDDNTSTLEEIKRDIDFRITSGSLPPFRFDDILSQLNEYENFEPDLKSKKPLAPKRQDDLSNLTSQQVKQLLKSTDTNKSALPYSELLERGQSYLELAEWMKTASTTIALLKPQIQVLDSIITKTIEKFETFQKKLE